MTSYEYYKLAYEAYLQGKDKEFVQKYGNAPMQDNNQQCVCGMHNCDHYG